VGREGISLSTEEVVQEKGRYIAILLDRRGGGSSSLWLRYVWGAGGGVVTGVKRERRGHHSRLYRGKACSEETDAKGGTVRLGAETGRSFMLFSVIYFSCSV
jgi:hypothetical protein